jgi:ankyrin repeat protein
MNQEAPSPSASPSPRPPVFLKRALPDGIDFEADILTAPNGQLQDCPVLCQLLHLDALTEAGVLAMLRAGADIMSGGVAGTSALEFALWNNRNTAFYALMGNGGLKYINHKFGSASAGESLLHIAIKAQCHGPATFLMDLGINVNAMDKWNVTPLMLAIDRVDFPLVRDLIEHGADVAAYERNGGCSLLQRLYNAAKNNAAHEDNEKKILRLLLDCGADPDAGKQLDPVIVEYTRQRRSDCIKIILDAGGDPDAKTEKGFYSRALDHAVRLKDAELIELLLQGGANPNQSGTNDELPLVRVALDKRADLIDLFFEYGADLNFENNAGLTVLCQILKIRPDIDMIEHLIDLGADVNKPCDNTFYTYPLHAAVQHGNIDIVNLLLKKGANPQVLSRSGETPWQTAHKLRGDENVITARLRLAEDAARITMPAPRATPPQDTLRRVNTRKIAS